MKFVVALLLGYVVAEEEKKEEEKKEEKKDEKVACTKENGDEKCKTEVAANGCCFITEILAIPDAMAGDPPKKKGDVTGECTTEADMKTWRASMANIKDTASFDMIEGMKARYDLGGDAKTGLQKDFGWKEDDAAKWEDQFDETTSPGKEMGAMLKEYKMKIIGCHNVAASVTAGTAALAAAFFMQ